jgi:hypothetical protein
MSATADNLVPRPRGAEPRLHRREPGTPLLRAAATNSDSREGEPPVAGPRHDRQPAEGRSNRPAWTPIVPSAQSRFRPDLFNSTRL